MARKSKATIIDSLGKLDKLTVQKSRPLYALWQSDLSLAEFKILDTYLSRIDSHNPDRRRVVFDKGELEEKLGVVKISRANLITRLKHLMGNVIEVPDAEERSGFKLVTLFEEVDADIDEYGHWKVTLECTEKAMKYFFNVESLGYIKYRLQKIVNLTSRYSYIMFLYLESNHFRKSWEVDLNELKIILGCNKEEIYKEFKRVNERILKRSQKELAEKSDYHFTYTPIKKGRTVVALRFEVKTQDHIQLDYDPNQLTIEDYIAHEEKKEELWVSALQDDNGTCEFTPDNINVIRQYLLCVPASRMPQHTAMPGEIDFARYHYMAQKMAILNARPYIDHRFAYLVKLIKEDADIAE